jgi:hypothetical protein
MDTRSTRAAAAGRDVVGGPEDVWRPEGRRGVEMSPSGGGGGGGGSERRGGSPNPSAASSAWKSLTGFVKVQKPNILLVLMCLVFTLDVTSLALGGGGGGGEPACACLTERGATRSFKGGIKTLLDRSYTINWHDGTRQLEGVITFRPIPGSRRNRADETASNTTTAAPATTIATPTTSVPEGREEEEEEEEHDAHAFGGVVGH